MSGGSLNKAPLAQVDRALISGSSSVPSSASILSGPVLPKSNYPVEAWKSLDWEGLVLAYDADNNGKMDPSELVCMVQDGLSLVGGGMGGRASYEVAMQVVSQQIAIHDGWITHDVRVDSVRAAKLRAAAAAGVFEGLRVPIEPPDATPIAESDNAITMALQAQYARHFTPLPRRQQVACH